MFELGLLCISSWENVPGDIVVAETKSSLVSKADFRWKCCANFNSCP